MRGIDAWAPRVIAEALPADRSLTVVTASLTTAAVLAESQLLLMRSDEFPADVVESLRAIEMGALRMRELLQGLKSG